MERKENWKIATFFLIGVLILFAVGLMFQSQKVSSAESNVCCERTLSGAWCQNDVQSQCDPNYSSTPTSCESTSYCKLGTCIDVQEGLCMENTPETACDQGTWKVEAPEDIPQCQLGCCFIGDQAAFVTSTRCTNLASEYGLEVSYRSDITNEAQCISLASPDVEGACVIEENLQRTCKFISRSECQDIEASTGEDGTVDFHEGLLCTNQNLNTNCAPTQKNTCVPGKDEVYFVDSCGNVANVYDSNQYDNSVYWNRVFSADELCTLDGNADSCGTCDYYSGSTCGEYRAGQDTRPDMGNNVCRNLGCDTNGDGEIDKEHGESWCALTDGTSSIEAYNPIETDSSEENTPGSEYYREICYNGEVSIEPCASWRSEVCVQSSLPDGTDEGFTAAACRVNRWQDCITQTSSEQCENSDQRDCKWIDVGWTPQSTDNPGVIVEDEDNPGKYGACVPLYSPAYDYWQENTEAGTSCGVASTTCVVVKDAGIDGGFFDIAGEEVNTICTTDQWKTDMENICLAMGDCGSSVNYIDEYGFYENWDKSFPNN